MAYKANCPSCGAAVDFRSPTSILAVCEYCQSSLLRSGETLENLGRMAALVADDSPLQLGSEGSWKGRHFALVGRIQLRYESGCWNEWHLLFDDGRTGWLSEASGEFVLSALSWSPDPLPTFDDARVGDQLRINGLGYVISNVLRAECVGGAGELPFKVGNGYPAPLIDLRGEDRFATIDYSDGKPMLFIGQSVPFKAFGWANLREDIAAAADVKAKALSCPSCGAAIELRADATETVACRHCGAVSDIYAGVLKLWARAKGVLAEAPWLPLDSRGTLRGEAVEVIGALVRATTVETVTYEWREYLLLTGGREYRWLSEYDGHWVLARVVSSPPNASNLLPASGIFYKGERYAHFQRSHAEVTYVIGEFNWKVRVGEACDLDDFVCEGKMLSREWSRDEITWSLGEYVEPDEIAKAFGIAAMPPPRIGIGACQPSPVAATHGAVCRRFWQFAALALLIQGLSLLFTGGKTLLRQEMALRGDQDEPAVSREFRIERAASALTVRNRTAIVNNWVELELALVETTTGKAWTAHREIAYYHGTDSDGSWSEGSPDDRVVFRGVPPGTYKLFIDPEMAPGTKSIVSDAVEIVEGETIWSNLVLFLLLTGAFPVFTRWRKEAFEIRRWAESDHPRTTSEDDDE